MDDTLAKTHESARPPHTQPCRPRTWLEGVRPAVVEHDDWVTYVEWGPDVDHAITRLRDQAPDLDALFRVAEGEGLGITPVWPDQEGEPHLLSDLGHTSDDTDWIMVAATPVWRATFTADMIVHPLAPREYTRHKTPTWTIYITAH